MSWDASIFKNRSAEDFDDVEPLGTIYEVRAIIDRHFPNATWHDDIVLDPQIPGVSLELTCCTQGRQNENLRNVLENGPIPGFIPPYFREVMEKRANSSSDDADELVVSIDVAGRGGGDFVTPLVEFCRATGWHLMNWQNAEFVDLDNPRDAQNSAADFKNVVDRLNRRNRSLDED